MQPQSTYLVLFLGRLDSRAVYLKGSQTLHILDYKLKIKINIQTNTQVL